MTSEFYLNLYTSMSGVMKKHILNTNDSICIPQKCVKHVFLRDGGVKYSKTVHYIEQSTEKNYFEPLELNTLLGHFRKDIKNIHR